MVDWAALFYLTGTLAFANDCLFTVGVGRDGDGDGDGNGNGNGNGIDKVGRLGRGVAVGGGGGGGCHERLIAVNVEENSVSFGMG